MEESIWAFTPSPYLSRYRLEVFSTSQRSIEIEYHAGKSSERPRPSLGITYDGYLKYLQLHKDEYAFVVVDECQDRTPCQGDLLWVLASKKRSSSYIYYRVGDENQTMSPFPTTLPTTHCSHLFGISFVATFHHYNVHNTIE